MLTGESKTSRIHGHINTESYIMEIWALYRDKHSWHGNYVLLLPLGRYSLERCGSSQWLSREQ